MFVHSTFEEHCFQDAALFIVLIYRQCARRDNHNSYCQTADEFERLAIEIFNTLYTIFPSVCSKAIIRKVSAYENVVSKRHIQDQRF